MFRCTKWRGPVQRLDSGVDISYRLHFDSYLKATRSHVNDGFNHRCHQAIESMALILIIRSLARLHVILGFEDNSVIGGMLPCPMLVEEQPVSQPYFIYLSQSWCWFSTTPDSAIVVNSRRDSGWKSGWPKLCSWMLLSIILHCRLLKCYHRPVPIFLELDQRDRLYAKLPISESMDCQSRSLALALFTSNNILCSEQIQTNC